LNSVLLNCRRDGVLKTDGRQQKGLTSPPDGPTIKRARDTFDSLCRAHLRLKTSTTFNPNFCEFSVVTFTALKRASLNMFPSLSRPTPYGYRRSHLTRSPSTTHSANSVADLSPSLAGWFAPHSISTHIKTTVQMIATIC
jgi:hypothetical protein